MCTPTAKGHWIVPAGLFVKSDSARMPAACRVFLDGLALVALALHALRHDVAVEHDALPIERVRAVVREGERLHVGGRQQRERRDRRGHGEQRGEAHGHHADHAAGRVSTTAKGRMPRGARSGGPRATAMRGATVSLGRPALRGHRCAGRRGGGGCRIARTSAAGRFATRRIAAGRPPASADATCGRLRAASADCCIDRPKGIALEEGQGLGERHRSRAAHRHR